MAQYKKNDIKQRIDDAAVSVFAKVGFHEARLADISKLSGVSIGNIYRYYKNKEELFYGVLPESVLLGFSDAIINRVSVSTGGGSPENGPLNEATDSLMRLVISNRLRLQILINGSAGTRYENFTDNFAEAMLRSLSGIFPDEFERYLRQNGSLDIPKMLYRNIVEVYSKALGLPLSDSELYDTLMQITRYHYAGITSLFHYGQGAAPRGPFHGPY
jgi:Transcriptional regulator